MDRRIIWSALGLAALLAAVPAHAQTPAAGADLTKTLTQAFDKDPAQGFVEATRLFKERQAAQDLDGMIAVIRVAEAKGYELDYWASVEDMFDVALPLAQAAGRWADLGELYYRRAHMLTKDAWDRDVFAKAPRYMRFAKLAKEAYARAGRTEQGPDEIIQLGEKHLAFYLPYEEDTFRREQAGPRWTPVIMAIEQALGEARDAEALGMMKDCLQALPAEPNRICRQAVNMRLSELLWVRGAEATLPALKASLVSSDYSKYEFEEFFHGLRLAWSGRPDAFYAAFYWAYACCPRTQGPPMRTVLMMSKLLQFGRNEEVDRLLATWIPWVNQSPESFAGADAHYLLTSRTPPEVRRGLVTMTIVGNLRLFASEKKSARDVYPFVAAQANKAPRGEEAAWAYDTGVVVADYALRDPEAGSRALGLEEAGRLFAKAGRRDLADQMQGLVASLTRGDPEAALQCAVPRAQAAANAGEWGEVRAALEGVVGEQAPSEAKYQAAVLLARAAQALGPPEQGSRWVAEAAEIVGDLKLIPVERASRLMELAGYAGDRTTKLTLLQRAQRLAQDSGIELVVNQAATQIAQAALDEGDLPAARSKLLEICNRHEAERDRLAFDPQLRQRWFADSLGPYRQLLRVAALQNDPALALSCAERMRSRALADELAWQKVDLATGLPAELRTRLENLRTMRTETYALLQRVTGGGAGGAGNRGEYLPIRGLLPDDKPVTAADAPKLKALLGKLATEEAALESAIREAVPAYAAAAATPIPAADAMALQVQDQGDLVLLEYTFSDQGLVVVAIGPHGGKVASLSQTAEQLWERVGKLRQAIWERKPEALTQAAELHDALVAPVAEVLKGATRVWVVADGALQLLPFAALRDKEGKYLAEGLAVAEAPSLSLALSSRGARPAPDKVALVVAAPDTGAERSLSDLRGEYLPIRGMYLPVRGEYLPIRGEGGVSDALTAMAKIPLPGAKAEGEVITQWMKGTVLLTGTDAGKDRLLKEANGAGILHLATHGYADPDFPDFSGVLLAGADGAPYSVLTAQEVYGMQLRAKLVVLSACQTALGKDVAGEGLLGLTRAFLYAGAQDVVCSLWPVSDESTKVLMEYFYQGLAADKTPEESLQQAQAALLHNKATALPFYWAGFVLMHGPR